MIREDNVSEDEGRLLLSMARRTIEKKLLNQEPQDSDAEVSDRLRSLRGTFVTLTAAGQLRGCIGHIVPHAPIIEGVRINAINAAFNDPRFSPLTKEELEKIKIEVSVLSEPKPLTYMDAPDLLRQLRPNIDGVILKKEFYQSVFLPQVWAQLPEKEAFLGHLCLKAGFDRDSWRTGDLEVFVFQVQAFEED